MILTQYNLSSQSLGTIADRYSIKRHLLLSTRLVDNNVILLPTHWIANTFRFSNVAHDAERY